MLVRFFLFINNSLCIFTKISHIFQESKNNVIFHCSEKRDQQIYAVRPLDGAIYKNCKTDIKSTGP